MANRIHVPQYISIEVLEAFPLKQTTSLIHKRVNSLCPWKRDEHNNKFCKD